MAGVCADSPELGQRELTEAMYAERRFSKVLRVMPLSRIRFRKDYEARTKVHGPRMRGKKVGDEVDG